MSFEGAQPGRCRHVTAARVRVCVDPSSSLQSAGVLFIPVSASKAAGAKTRHSDASSLQLVGHPKYTSNTTHL